MRTALPQALDVLVAELHGPDRLDAARTILRHAGLDASRGTLDLSATGPTDADEIEAVRAETQTINELLAPIIARHA